MARVLEALKSLHLPRYCAPLAYGGLFLGCLMAGEGGIKGSEQEGQGSPCRWGQTAANLRLEGKFAGKIFLNSYLTENN